MLETAVAVADGGHLEQIAVERRGDLRRAAEEIDLPLADAREIAREPLEIGVLPAGDRDLVAHAARGERGEREIAHLDRMVDQLVVVRRAIAAEAVRRRAVRGQRRRDAPVRVSRRRRANDVERARRLPRVLPGTGTRWVR